MSKAIKGGFKKVVYNESILFDLTLHILAVLFRQNICAGGEPAGEVLEKQRLGGLAWGSRGCPSAVLGFPADER